MLRVLETCFGSEIAGMPGQPRPSRARDRCEAEGLIVADEMALKGWPPVVVRGHRLTERGRLFYCEACDG